MIILFQSIFLQGPNVVIETPGINQTSGENFDDYYTDYIMYNNVKYNPERILRLMIIACICTFLLPAVFYINFKRLNWFSNLKLSFLNVRLIPFVIYMFFVLIFGTVLLDYLFFSVSGKEFVFPKIDTGGNIVFNIGVFLVFVFIPAACEEIIFRAVLVSEYENYGFLISLFITSAAFAMSKFSLQLFCAYFFASVIFFICLKITNSIIVPVILNTGYSFFIIYIEDALMDILKFEQNKFIFLFSLCIFFIVSLYLSLSAMESHYHRKAYKNEPSPVKISESQDIITNFVKIFLSPTFIAVIIIFFVYISIVAE